jgi:hypothetical protein
MVLNSNSPISGMKPLIALLAFSFQVMAHDALK